MMTVIVGKHTWHLDNSRHAVAERPINFVFVGVKKLDREDGPNGDVVITTVRGRSDDVCHLEVFVDPEASGEHIVTYA